MGLFRFRGAQGVLTYHRQGFVVSALLIALSDKKGGSKDL